MLATHFADEDISARSHIQVDAVAIASPSDARRQEKDERKNRMRVASSRR
jgi:hypothetical protein